MDYRKEYSDFIVKDIRHVIKRKPSTAWNFKGISHPKHYVVALVLSGECLYSFHGRKCPAVEGDIIFFQKNIKHSVQSSSERPWSFISTTFDIETTDEEKNIFSNFSNIFKSNDFSHMTALFTELNHLWIEMHPYYLLKCRALITEILYIILRQKNVEGFVSPHTHSIKKVLDIIVRNYGKNYTVEELALITNLSYSHFSYLFKIMTGNGVIEYQNQVKINKAKNILLSGESNVTEAAHAVGFNNIYYFSRLFKKVTGVAPSEYLKM